MNNFTKLLIAVVVIAVAWFYFRGPQVSISNNNSGNSVKILSVSPDVNTPLRVGSSVDISVEVEYSLKQENGSIALVLQRGDSNPSMSSTLGNVVEPIQKGTGKLTLKANITVPSTNSIQVFTPLSVLGESKTTTVDMRVYKVTGN